MKSISPAKLLLGLLALVTVAVATPEKWAEAVDQITAADVAHPPPKDAVVFVGSSSIVLWPLTESFPDIATVNRGFGGSELADSAFYADRLVIPCHPRLVVLYAGENDLSAGKAPAAILADFQAFRGKIHAALPHAKIIYLSTKESRARAHLREKILQTNALIATDCATDPRCRYVDVASPLLDADGGLRPDLFRDDKLHLAPTGYAIWTKVLAPYLKP